MKQETKRNVILDWLRGFGILLMILGHIDIPQLHIFIYAFHMPLFFMISGYLCNCNRGFWSSVSHRVKRLLVPYVFFGIVNWLIYAAIHSFQGSDLMELLFNLMFFPTKGLAIAGALWFLLSIFLVEVMFRSILLVKLPEWVRAALVLVLMVFGFWINAQQIKLIWGLETALIGLFFYYLGYLSRQYSLTEWLNRDRKKMICRVILLVGLIPSIWLCVKNGQVGMFFGFYGNPFFFILNAIFLCLFCWMIAKIIASRNMVLLNHPIYAAGRDSVLFLGINQFYIICCNRIIPVILARVGIETGTVYTGLFIGIEIVLVLCGLYLTSIITSKMKISRIWK